MRRFLLFTLFRRFYGNSYCPARSSCANTAHGNIFSDFLPLFLFLFAFFACFFLSLCLFLRFNYIRTASIGIVIMCRLAVMVVIITCTMVVMPALGICSPTVCHTWQREYNSQQYRD